MPGLVDRLRAADVLSLQLVKTALAAGVAYECGRLAGSPFPVFAALAALLVVQVTVYDSVSRGLQRVVGVVLGVLVAYAIAAVLGLHAWTVGLVVLTGIVLARLLRIGEGGAVQVPVSGLLVLTVGSTGDYAVDRVVETVIGAAVGVVVNLVLAPPTRTRDAGRQVLALAGGAAAVLRAAGASVREDRWVAEAPGWLERARGLDATVRSAREAVERGEQSLRLNPRGHRLIGAAARRRVALRALEHVAVQVRGVARTLADVASDPTPPGARVALGDALQAVAVALVAYGAVAAEPEAHETSEEATQLRAGLAEARLAVSHAVAAASAEPAFAEGAWLTHGSLLTDLDRVLGELDGQSQTELLQAQLGPRVLSRLALPHAGASAVALSQAARRAARGRDGRRRGPAPR